MFVNVRKIPKVASGLWWGKIHSIKIFLYLQVTILGAETSVYESWRFNKSKASLVEKVWWNLTREYLTVICQRIAIRQSSQTLVRAKKNTKWLFRREEKQQVRNRKVHHWDRVTKNVTLNNIKTLTRRVQQAYDLREGKLIS